VTCVFCSIVAGDLPAHIVIDDEHTMAFLDTKPLFPGHTLLIPRDHHVTLAELPTEKIEPVFQRARVLAAVMEGDLGAKGSFVAMNNRVSQSVPHLHIHVVPRRPKDGLRGFFWPRQKYDGEGHMAEVAATLRAGFDGRWAELE
jgi:histidine triad (HIT) family protein